MQSNYYLSFSVLKTILRRSLSSYKPAHKRIFLIKEPERNSHIVDLIKKYEPKLLYSSVIEDYRLKYGFHQNNALLHKFITKQNKQFLEEQSVKLLPISLKYLIDSDSELLGNTAKTNKFHDVNDTNAIETSSITHFPYESNLELPSEIDNLNDHHNKECLESENSHENVTQELKDEVMQRNQLQTDLENWMSAYDNYNEESCNEISDEHLINYGTPDPSCKISSVPCGGCGALLHCKDSAIPGYIPSEIYKNCKSDGGASLSSIICQRCYFLKVHNIALQVQVRPEYYPQILKTISGKPALVVLMVDLLDFPCSIWPGIADIFGKKTPVVVVGNKVDLLPQDDEKFLTNIKKVLISTVRESGFTTFNIKHVALISAKTGFGIEELITQLQAIWKHKGDVYLVGCTNVGKSSLFNTLLQSDYCKSEASDLIQRATTSIWPGTTLNLLKFPILRPSGHRLYLRHKRLTHTLRTMSQIRKLRKQQLRKTSNPEYASLVGYIDRTFPSKTYVDLENEEDAFQMQGNSEAKGRLLLGINENDPRYALSRWCFDTPGVVQPDQIVNLLTTEELMLTLPKELIRPKTFCVKPGTSLFIAGLARFDYVEGPTSLRLTIFCSNGLPITLCSFDEADQFYKELLGTEIFKVPINNQERLSKWPGLQLAKTFSVTGVGTNFSCKDVVLSNAGWISITGNLNMEFKLQAWTPEKRGVYIRDSLLPRAVCLRGSRIRGTPAYKCDKFYLK